LGWLNGYGPLFGTWNDSTRISCLAALGFASSSFLFFEELASGNMILKNEKQLQ
jgi:hypothetical protein